MTHLTLPEFRTGATVARVDGLTLAACAKACGIDCIEGLAVASTGGRSWCLVDLDDEERGFVPVVASGYVDSFGVHAH
jgi:hypothetical protein